jgi:hypothetical protein
MRTWPTRAALYVPNKQLCTFQQLSTNVFNWPLHSHHCDDTCAATMTPASSAQWRCKHTMIAACMTPMHVAMALHA